MISNLNILLPEVFLTLSIFVILMIGVFIKKSFNLIFNLSSVIILITIAIILNAPNITEKIFLEIRNKHLPVTFEIYVLTRLKPR